MLAFLLSLPVLATSATDTWADVSPIVSRNCSTCHHDDGAGPFPLLSHADVSRRRSFIAEVLRRKLMPPWLPGDEGVTLHDDRSMPEADRNRLIAWLDAGAPARDGIAPIAITPPDTLPYPPDAITIALEEPFSIPSETIENEHRYHQDTWSFVMPLQNEQPILLRGVGWKTAAPKAIHTVTLLADEGCRGRARDDYDPRAGYERDGDLDRNVSGALGGIGIGIDRLMLPDGFHWSIPPNSDLVVELKYRPIGRERPLDETAYLVPASGEDSREIVAVVTGANRLQVVAGESNHVEVDRFTLPADFDVVAIIPRGRNECRSMRLTALMPDGERSVLLDVPDWDVHFRRPFRLASVQSLPEGTTLISRFVIDNSRDNPRNPYDPPEDLRIGRRTGVVGFTLLGAGKNQDASDALVEASEWTMDRRGMKKIPKRTPIPDSTGP